MGTNQINEALEQCNAIVQQATSDYDKIIQGAATQLYEAIQATKSEPLDTTEPSEGQMLISKEQYEMFQQLMPVIEKLANTKPELLGDIKL